MPFGSRLQTEAWQNNQYINFNKVQKYINSTFKTAVLENWVHIFCFKTNICDLKE